MAQIKARGLSKKQARIAAGGILSVGVFVLSALPVFSQLSAPSALGGLPGNFLLYGVGARALAMGGAYYGISNDASAGSWNPAGLAQLQRKQLTVMDGALAQQTGLDYAAYAQPLKGGSAFAGSITKISAGGFQNETATYDPNGNLTGLQSNGSFTAQQEAFDFSWARNLTKTTAFGATIQEISNTLAGSADTTQALNIGMMKNFGGFYHLGLGVQNAFSRTSGATNDQYPVIVRMGNAVDLFHDRLILDLDINKPLTPGLDVRFGGEYHISQWFAFRFGLMGLPGIQETDFGFGLDFKTIQVDIAEGIGNLGSSTKISLTFKFGQTKNADTNAKVKAVLRMAFEALQQGNFTLAQARFKEALYIQPGNQKILDMVNRLKKVTDHVAQATGGQEFQTFLRKGAVMYVEGHDYRGAVNALRYAYNKNPKDEKLLRLLNVVEKDAHVTELTRRVGGPEQFTWVDQKIYDARQSVYEGHYDAAIRRAQDVLDLEPDNLTALEILGSSFYLMDQKQKAIAVWKRVLELDPHNKEVRQFMQAQ